MGEGCCSHNIYTQFSFTNEISFHTQPVHFFDASRASLTKKFICLVYFLLAYVPPPPFLLPWLLLFAALCHLFLTWFFLFVILCFCIEFLFVYVAFCTRFSAVLFHYFFVCLVLFFFFILIYLFTCCKYYLVLSCTSVSQINAQVLDLLLSCVSFVL